MRTKRKTPPAEYQLTCNHCGKVYFTGSKQLQFIADRVYRGPEIRAQAVRFAKAQCPSCGSVEFSVFDPQI